MHYLSDRIFSTYPVSIATSIALEAFGNGPKAPYPSDNPVVGDKVDLLRYRQIWFNLFTLYRNMMAAAPEKDPTKYSVAMTANELQKEADIIGEIIREKSNGKVKAIFYICNYSDLFIRHPHARIRKENTPIQLRQAEHFTACFNLIQKKGWSAESEMRTFKNEICGDKEPSLVVTHYPYDLLAEHSFGQGNLHLLESHTRKLKPRALWYTKYYKGTELMRIPFNRIFLQVFGDNYMFHPLDRRVRLLCLNMAQAHKWTNLTTLERIRLCISLISEADPLDRAAKRLLTEIASS